MYNVMFIKGFGMVANATTIYQNLNEVDVSKYRQPYGLQQRETTKPYNRLQKP